MTARCPSRATRFLAQSLALTATLELIGENVNRALGCWVTTRFLRPPATPTQPRFSTGGGPSRLDLCGCRGLERAAMSYLFWPAGSRRALGAALPWGRGSSRSHQQHEVASRFL